MDWSAQRKLLYLGTLFGTVFILLAIFIYFRFFNRPPSCTDGIMNQNELGVDCGGVCALLCPSESRPPIIEFARLFKIKDGEYSALAMVENPNQNVYSERVNYIFKVYDVNNILLFEIPGSTFVPPGRVFPVYEHSILTGYREASKVTFDIVGDPLWIKGEFIDPDLRISNVQGEKLDSRFRVTAQIMNKEVYVMKNVPVTVVIYDDKSNVRESSATVIDYISPNDSTNVSFTWGHSFDFDISKIDIIPRPTPRDWTKSN